MRVYFSQGRDQSGWRGSGSAIHASVNKRDDRPISNYNKIISNGIMTQYLANLPLGSEVEFKHVEFNVKLQYPFGKKKVGILCGGSGVTPMIQVLHAILGTEGDETEVLTLSLGLCGRRAFLCVDLKSPAELNGR